MKVWAFRSVAWEEISAPKPISLGTGRFARSVAGNRVERKGYDREPAGQRASALDRQQLSAPEARASIGHLQSIENKAEKQRRFDPGFLRSASRA
jgi:hypothetical protein